MTPPNEASVTLDVLTRENLSMQFCSDHLKAQIAALMDERDRLRDVVDFGLNIMLPEIHAQKSCWPGEVDDFDEMAKKALRGTK